MNDSKDFVIHDGTLEKYLGNDPEVTVPDGVRFIKTGAFFNNNSLVKLTIPESVEKIDLVAFHGCDKLSIINILSDKQLLEKDIFGAKPHIGSVLPEGMIDHINIVFPHMKNDALKQYVLKKEVWETIPLATRAEIVLTRQSKALNAAYTFKRDETDDLISEMSKKVVNTSDEKEAKVLVAFVLDYLDEISFETIKAAYAALYKNKLKALKKLVLDNRFQQRWTSLAFESKQDEKPLLPIEKLVRDNWRSTEQTKKLRQIIKSEVKYRNSKESAPVDVVAFVINEYSSQLVMPKMISLYKTGYVKCKISELADKVAESLDLDSLRQLLEQIAYDEKNYKDGFILALGRYASGKQISHLTAMMREWETWWKYKATGRANIMIARGALFLSDTREAMMALDKVGVLGEYASMRRTNEDVLRDTALSDFGFDAEGKKIYRLGGNNIYASVGKDLSVVLYDENAKKHVKSIPKKNADESLLKEAKADLADLKKNLKRVLTNRRNKLFDDFLSGKEYSPADWKGAFVENPVLRAVAELLVWDQDSNTFTLDGKKAVDYKGMEVQISDITAIRVAHPYDMSADTILGWQDYFSRRGLKQPFEQIWEPKIDFNSVSKERYTGLKIPVLKFANMEKHGIQSYGVKSFSDAFGFELRDCQLDAEASVWRFEFGVTDDATYQLGDFSVLRESRWSNHIIYILDKWTLTDRILKDDVSIGSLLPSFTLPQILEFINTASKNKAFNSLAVLMDYKNANYQDVDPLKEYVLD